MRSLTKYSPFGLSTRSLFDDLWNLPRYKGDFLPTVDVVEKEDAIICVGQGREIEKIAISIML